MSIVYIGRCGRGLASLEGIATWDISGRQVKITGWLQPPNNNSTVSATDLDLVLAERQRLNGYVGNFDEQVVPAIWQCDPTATGFYRVQGVSVNFQGPSLRSGVFPITIDMEQVKGYASPQMEVLIVGATVTNPHGITGDSWFAFPDDVTEQLFRTDCELGQLRVADSGDIAVTSCFQHFNGTLRQYLTPDTFYVGACNLYVGDPLELVVGTQIPREVHDWRLDNGLVRVEPYRVGAGVAGLKVSHYSGTAWLAPNYWLLSGAHSSAPVGNLTDISNITVIRNSPETVVFRLSLLWTLGPSQGRTFLDITLRRGDRIANCYLTSDKPNKWQLSKVPVEAATAVTGGIRATNATDGHRWVIMSSDAFNSNLTTGYIEKTVDTSETFPFGISLEINGASAQTIDTVTRLIKQYHSGQTERLKIVAR